MESELTGYNECFETDIEDDVYFKCTCEYYGDFFVIF